MDSLNINKSQIQKPIIEHDPEQPFFGTDWFPKLKTTLIGAKFLLESLRI
jgi:hypothetical protein